MCRRPALTANKQRHPTQGCTFVFLVLVFFRQLCLFSFCDHTHAWSEYVIRDPSGVQSTRSPNVPVRHYGRPSPRARSMAWCFMLKFARAAGPMGNASISPLVLNKIGRQRLSSCKREEFWKCWINDNLPWILPYAIAHTFSELNFGHRFPWKSSTKDGIACGLVILMNA